MTQKTVVWWDKKSCPVPPNCDARLIGRIIESKLKESGYSGPLTINATGYLKEDNIDHEVLRKLSSTGIVLKHVFNGLTSILMDMFACTSNDKPTRANFMLISDGVKRLSSSLYTLQEAGYTILLAYPKQAEPADDLVTPNQDWVWESLLADAMDSDNNNQEKCSETVESPWFCHPCDKLYGKGFEKFTDHLKSEEHKLNELDLMQHSCKSKLIPKKRKIEDRGEEEDDEEIEEKC